MDYEYTLTLARRDDTEFGEAEEEAGPEEGPMEEGTFEDEDEEE